MFLNNLSASVLVFYYPGMFCYNYIIYSINLTAMCLLQRWIGLETIRIHGGYYMTSYWDHDSITTYSQPYKALPRHPMLFVSPSGCLCVFLMNSHFTAWVHVFVQAYGMIAIGFHTTWILKFKWDWISELPTAGANIDMIQLRKSK